MPSVVLARTLAGGAVTTQNAYIRTPGQQTLSPLAIPSNIAMTGVRPSIARLGTKTIFAGCFSRPMVYDQFQDFLPAAIAAPVVPPVLALGTSSGGTTGSTFGYVAFRQKNGNIIVQESNPSGISNILNSTGTGLVWTVPGSALDSRVTHVVGYKSYNGAIAAQAFERPIGVTTVLENVPQANLGVSLLALPPDTSGNVFPNTTARGIPPYCKYVEAFNFCMAYAGDPNHPERIYLSLLNEAESVDSVSSRGFVSTIDGEPVTGIRRWQNNLLVGTTGGFYLITGYSPADFDIVRIGKYYKCLAGASMIRIGQNEDVWFISQEGPCLWNGTFIPLFGDFASYWRDVLYGQNRAGVEDSIAVQDTFFKTYRCLIPQLNGTSLYLVGHYEPVSRGMKPKWVFDIRNRQDSTVGLVIGAGSQFNDQVVTGSCDGYVRNENVTSDATDDGDTYQKKFTFQSKHVFAGDQGGDDSHGHAWTDLDLFLMSENQNAQLALYGGDDQAYLAKTPQWTGTYAATKATDPSTGNPKVPRTSQRFSPLAGISGKGCTLTVNIPLPQGVQLRGFALSFIEGGQERPST